MQNIFVGFAIIGSVLVPQPIAAASPDKDRCTYVASSGSLDEDYCGPAEKVAIQLYAYLKEGDLTTEMAGTVFDDGLLRVFKRSIGDTISFLTPTRGQDFFVAQPAQPVKTTIKGNEGQGSVVIDVTFDEAFGRPPARLTTKRITLLVRNTAKGWRIYNVNNGRRWLRS